MGQRHGDGALAASIAWWVVHDCGTTAHTLRRGLKQCDLIKAGSAAQVPEPRPEKA